MTDIETKMPDHSVTLDQLHAYDPSIFEHANRDLTRLIEQYPDSPTFGEHELRVAMEEMGIDHYFMLLKDIYNLSADSVGIQETEERRTYIPPREYFDEIPERAYIGADGKERKALLKFVPRHIAQQLQDLTQASYSVINDLKVPNAHTRPGLIVQSGYRSPWYQTMIITRMIDKYGLPEAFKYVALAGGSQHSDAEEPAVDFMVIGDENGQRAVDPNTGLFDEISSFEQSLEFEYLLANAPDLGFWLPYHPNPDDPLSNTSTTGIVFEPWHWQYVGDSAKDLMEQNKVYHSIMVRKQSRNN